MSNPIVQDEFYYRMQGQTRGPDGRFIPVEEVGPLPDGSLSGGPPSSMAGIPPPLPPRRSQRPSIDSKTTLGSPSETSVLEARIDSAYLAQLPPAERARIQRVPRMDPHLQLMVGPLLRYDTVDENGLWHGAALIVSTSLSRIVHRDLLMVLGADSCRFGIFL